MKYLNRIIDLFTISVFRQCKSVNTMVLILDGKKIHFETDLDQINDLNAAPISDLPSNLSTTVKSKYIIRLNKSANIFFFNKKNSC